MAKYYILAGGDIFSLQRILGHNSMETVRIYVEMFSNGVNMQHSKFSFVEHRLLSLAARPTFLLIRDSTIVTFDFEGLIEMVMRRSKHPNPLMKYLEDYRKSSKTPLKFEGDEIERLARQQVEAYITYSKLRRKQGTYVSRLL